MRAMWGFNSPSAARRRFEHFWRNALLRALCLLLPRSRAVPTDAPLSKIIVVRASHNLGDVVMSSAVLDECRAQFPDARLALLVNARLSGLFRHHDAVDALYELEPRWFLHPLKTARLLRAVRRERFDLAMDCSNVSVPSLNNWLLVWLTAARRRVGFRERGAEAFLTTLVDGRLDRHFISVQLQLLSPFTKAGAFRMPRLVVTVEERQSAEKLLEGIARPRVMLFVPEPRPKCWALEQFLALAERLAAQPVGVVFAFGPNDPRRNCEAVRLFRQRRGNAVGVLPPLQLREFAAAIAVCDVFVSNDCGPMHVAVAVGTPTVSVFLFDNDFAHGYHDGITHFVVKGASADEQVWGALEKTRGALASVKRTVISSPR
jgi:ADP-heptose:LPS heptosyltransferase